MTENILALFYILGGTMYFIVKINISYRFLIGAFYHTEEFLFSF